MALGHPDELTLPSGPEVVEEHALTHDAARCRAVLDAWEADPFPTDYVQVEASLLRAVLDRLEAAEAVYVDLRDQGDAATEHPANLSTERRPEPAT